VWAHQKGFQKCGGGLITNNLRAALSSFVCSHPRSTPVTTTLSVHPYVHSFTYNLITAERIIIKFGIGEFHTHTKKFSDHYNFRTSPTTLLTTSYCGTACVSGGLIFRIPAPRMRRTLIPLLCITFLITLFPQKQISDSDTLGN
jgi:hypothetical protein